MAKTKAMPMSSLEKDLYSLAGSVGILAGNIALGGLIPFGNLIPIALTSITGGMALNNLFNNRWEKIFRDNHICNPDGEIPKLLHEFKSKDETETKYIFEMPKKLTPYSLMQAQNVLESAMHKPMKISVTKNFYAEIIVFEKASLDYMWHKIFKSCDVSNKLGEYPQFVKVEETKIGLRHIFKLPIGLCVEIFERISPLIQSAINKPIKLSVTQDNLLVIQEYQVQYSPFYLPLYNRRFNFNNTKNIAHIDLTQDKTKDLVFPIGIKITENGVEIVYINLTDEPNILVSGTTGSGKSSFIKCLLTTMILRNIEIKILDLKFSGDYNVFRNYKHLTTFTTDLSQARNDLNEVKNVMDERYKKLNQTNCKNYSVYNNKFKDDKMKPIVVVVEEYYMLNSKKNKATDILNPILSKCRACNIKFVIILQRPCKDNLDPVLKANLNHVVGFRAVSKPNSEVVLGDGDYRLFLDLHDKGEAIIHDMYQDVAFKSFFLEDDEDSNEAFFKEHGYKFDFTISDIIAHKCKKPIDNQIPTEQPAINKSKTISIDTLKQKQKGKVDDLIC